MAQCVPGTAPISLSLWEDDKVSDDDKIGTIETGTEARRHSRTIRQDGAEYEVSYDLRLGD